MRLCIIILLSVFIIGCKPTSKITTYEVKSQVVENESPKTNEPKANGMPASAAMQAEAARFGTPQWSIIPTGWITNPENPMRKGSWTIKTADGKKAEISVTVFPGDVGGITANVNRWRSQLGLPSATEDEIVHSSQKIKVGADDGLKFSLTSADQKKGTLALLIPKKDATWFCKLTGDSEIIQAQTEIFLEFFKKSQLP